MDISIGGWTTTTEACNSINASLQPYGTTNFTCVAGTASSPLYENMGVVCSGTPTPSVPTPSVPTPTPTATCPFPGMTGSYDSPCGNTCCDSDGRPWVAAPTPSVPTPSVPTPSVPTPSVPTPSVPTPSATLYYAYGCCNGDPLVVEGPSNQTARADYQAVMGCTAAGVKNNYADALAAAQTGLCAPAPTPSVPTPSVPTPSVPTPSVTYPALLSGWHYCADGDRANPASPCPYDGSGTGQTCLNGGASGPSCPNPTPTPSVPTPSVPTPSVPTPSVPTPSVPTPTAYCYCVAYGYAIDCNAYCPTAPTPSVPTPSVPTPSVPTPSVPTPSVPTPSVPTPSVPTPSAPSACTPGASCGYTTASCGTCGCCPDPCYRDKIYNSNCSCVFIGTYYC